MSGKLLLSLLIFAAALLWRGRRKPRGDEPGLRRLGAADLLFLAAALLAVDATIPRLKSPPAPARAAAEAPASPAPAPAEPPPPPAPEPEPEPAAAWDLEYGAYLAENCAACHAGGLAAAPRLEGRPFEDLRAALEAYASGARPHDQMGVVARSLSAEERGHVAAWFAAQPAP